MPVEQRYERLWHGQSLPLWLRVALFTGLYLACAAVGRNIYSDEGFVAFWLPAGLYTAALMIHPREAWPPLIAAAFAANLVFDWWQGLSWLPTIAFAACASFESVLGVALLRRVMGPAATLFRLREFIGFLLFVVLLAPALSAVLGALTLWWAGLEASLWVAWQQWFASEAIGIILATPLLVAWLAKWPERPQGSHRPARLAEALLLYLALLLASAAILMHDGLAYPYSPWLIPLLLWAGLRLGLRGASVASALFALSTAYLLTRGYTDFATIAMYYDEEVLRWQLYLATSALVALTPAVVLGERDRTLAALNEREQRYKLLTEASFEGICVMRDGLVIESNEQMLRMTRLTRAELIGRPGLNCVAPESRAQVEAALGSGQENIGEHLHIRGDGTRFWAEVRVRASKVDGHELLTVAVRDITERKAAEDEIRQLNAELEQRVAARTADLTAANRELEAFSYSVSHDLRAPLRHIAGFTAMLSESAAPLDQEAKRYIDRIRSAVQRMDAIVEGLLTLAHLGRSTPRLKAADLAALVHEAREQVAPESRDRHIEWRIDPLPRVDADPALLQLALVNLLHNAVKYTDGRDPARIHVGGHINGNEAIVFVRDNGAGFDMRFADKLYGVGQRLHGDKEFEGVGIGLANVQRIIERHGGRVWAEGAVNRGATFYFALPVRHD